VTVRNRATEAEMCAMARENGSFRSTGLGS
jgi:hypothetical protein